MKRYAIWDKKSPVIVPTGKVFTAAQWKEKYPAVTGKRSQRPACGP